MKGLVSLLIAGALIFGVAHESRAVEFKASGDWMFAFGAADTSFVKNAGSRKSGVGGQDNFDARQRVRLKLQAIASESLSGTIYFEIGDQKWGQAKHGAALGTDGTRVEVKNAYLDWTVPNTNLSLRMGLQGVYLPEAAGGNAIFADDVAGITASYKINDTVSITALWGRLYNDNFQSGEAAGYNDANNFLDNMDMVSVAVPITLDGWSLTPWALMSFTGKNTMPGLMNKSLPFPYPASGLGTAGMNLESMNTRNWAYSSAFWVGIPIKIQAFDPWNLELDINYGSSEGFGKYTATSSRGDSVRASSKREGWLIKALAEYKFDWGTPGIFGWYASGDTGIKDGSGRMPYLDGWGSFTSFLGDNIYAWNVGGGGSRNSGYEISSMYSGTWGIGAQIKNISFLEDLKHTLRVTYWGGTNAPSMAKYMIGNNGTHSKGWDSIDDSMMYLTTQDSLVEINVDSVYKIYENLEAVVELGYVVNGMDTSLWKKHSSGNDRQWEKADAWKAVVLLKYSF